MNPVHRIAQIPHLPSRPLSDLHRGNGKSTDPSGPPAHLHGKVEFVTPELASTLIGTMPRNRRMRRSKIEAFAREMVTARWHLNGEPIIVADTGELLDGKHRLSAIVMAKVGVWLFVVRGVQTAAMATIDTGTSRSYGDVLMLRGGSTLGPQIGAIARLWWLYDNTETLNSKVTLAHQELDDMTTLHPVIEEGAIRAHRSPFKRHMPASVYGFVFGWLTEREDPEIAELFMTTVEKGAHLDETDPIFVLRRVLINLERRDSALILALVIKAYNLWLAGTPIQNLTWRKGEAFPRFGARPTRGQRLHQTRKREAGKLPVPERPIGPKSTGKEARV